MRNLEKWMKKRRGLIAYLRKKWVNAGLRKSWRANKDSH